MKKIVILSVLGLLALAVPAQATTQYTPAPTPPPHGPKAKGKGPHNPKSHRCQPHSVGYNATGTLVTAALTPATGKNRYDGTLEVNVSKANHKAPTGAQTYTLAAARVIFHHGVDPTAPAPGSRVKLHGKITQLSRHCSQEGFTPTVTIKKVDIRQAPAKPAV